ncbi:hypothetical protein, partial [Vibrio pectenicida]|uniref:hypothetical protein n=1 Tax=Vibrio pectenicida TaxID=62763 RepID=UPI001C10FA16
SYLFVCFDLKFITFIKTGNSLLFKKMCQILSELIQSIAEFGNRYHLFLCILSLRWYLVIVRFTSSLLSRKTNVLTLV